MLEAISKDPFRILGVYTNARQSDIVRNIGRMKAYLNVGKAVQYDTDMTSVLPTVQRTLDSLQQALAAINLPLDKIKHALFGFCRPNRH